MIDLLAGAVPKEISDTHQQMIEDMIRVFEAQKLASLSDLFGLADNLDSVTRGEKLNTQLAQKLASRISEIQLPRSAMSGMREKNFMSVLVIGRNATSMHSAKLISGWLSTSPRTIQPS